MGGMALKFTSTLATPSRPTWISSWCLQQSAKYVFKVGRPFVRNSNNNTVYHINFYQLIAMTTVNFRCGD